MNAHPDASRGAQSTTNGKMTRLAMKPSSVNTVGPILPIVETGEPPRKRPRYKRVNDPIIIAANVSKATLEALQLHKTMPLMPLKIADGRIHFFIPTIWNQPSSDEWILSGYCSNSEVLHFTFKITDDLWQAADDIMEVYLDTKGDSRRTTDFDKQAKSIIWILRYISSCVRIVLGVLPSKKQRQWNNRARMVNRIVNRLGLRGLGLPYAYALVNCKFATIMDMSEGIRDQVANLVAQNLLEKDLNMRDDVGLLCMATLIRSILQEEMSYEDICKHIHLPNFVDKPIELPFARLEHIKAKLNVPPKPDLDEDLGKDMERLNSVPRISPLRAINGYEAFSTSADLQMKALDAGMCQCSSSSSGFHSVIGDSYSYTWSRLHLAVYYQALKDSVAIGFIQPGKWLFTRNRAIHQHSGTILTPAGYLQFIIPTTTEKCSVSMGIPKRCEMCYDIPEQCEVCSGDDSFEMTPVPWNIHSWFVSRTCISTQTPIDYISILVPITTT